MKEFVCRKCNSSDVFINESGNNTGLYCGDCGAWITWLNKDQSRLAERQIERNNDEDLKVLLERLCDYTMNDIRKVCNEIGVDIVSNDGGYRNIYEVVIDLYEKFNC